MSERESERMVSKTGSVLKCTVNSRSIGWAVDVLVFNSQFSMLRPLCLVFARQRLYLFVRSVRVREGESEGLEETQNFDDRIHALV